MSLLCMSYLSISSVANTSLANILVEDFLRQENISINRKCELGLKRAVCQHLSSPDLTTFAIRLATWFQSETDTKNFIQYYEVSYITLFVNIIIDLHNSQPISEIKFCTRYLSFMKICSLDFL